MKLKKEYENFLKLAIHLNKMFDDTSCSKIEVQENKLFYWLIKQIIFVGFQKSSSRITLSVKKFQYDERVRVQCGKNEALYSESGITASKFFNIMKDILNIFNSVPEYDVTYLHEDENNKALIIIDINSLG